MRDMNEHEWRELVDSAARFYLGISGDEFVANNDAGRYDDCDEDEHADAMMVAILLPDRGRRDAA